MIEILIWGAGRLGVCAYHYYKQNNVKGFIDSNSEKWGMTIEGVTVFSPDILAHSNYMVVVASRYNSDEIIKEIKGKKSTCKIVIFDTHVKEIDEEKTESIDYGTALSFRFSGGLGNQMFQYAVYKSFQSVGRNIFARNASGSEKLAIEDAFKKIELRKITSQEENSILAANVEDNTKNGFFAIYKEKLGYGIVKQADKRILGIETGIVQGLFQTCYFADSLRKDLLSDFEFKVNENTELKCALEEIEGCNSVAVHIRQGDYLLPNNAYIYGGICTQKYYIDAINYVRSRVDNPVFYLFSNDLKTALNILGGEEVRFFPREDFGDYEDWFDMCLISHCKHSIIANSTFSWWGAWLNQNRDRMIIAPKKWINTYDYKDIYPKDWIVM